MPALTPLAIAAAIQAYQRLRRFAERVKNRRDVMRLASLDDRLLADIGLCRSDLRDAYAELPWRNASDVLVRRVAERRLGRRRTASSSLPVTLTPPVPDCPRLDRPARFTV